jgi:hypothetical protein
VLHQVKYRDFSLDWLCWHHTMLRFSPVSEPLLLFLLFSLPFHININYFIGSIVDELLFVCS